MGSSGSHGSDRNHSGISGQELFYGNAVAWQGRAMLVSGCPGSGKSDLTLRYLSHFAPGLFSGQGNDNLSFTGDGQQGAALISDDQTVVTRQGSNLFASPPKTIAGRLEVRGVGIITLPFCPQARISLAIELKETGIPRFLDRPPTSSKLLGLEIPRVRLDPFGHSAPIKMKLLLDLYGLRVCA